MFIDGNGIDVAFEVDVQHDYKPMTYLALKWRQASDGNWNAVDRTSSEDVYMSQMSIYGTEGTVNQVISAFDANRAAGTPSTLYFYDLNEDGELFFGADVDNAQTVDTYANAYKVDIVSIDRRVQQTWKGWRLNFVARLQSPAFTGSASFPTLCPLVGYDGDSDYTINREWSFTGTSYWMDRQADHGSFTFSFELDASDMVSLRRWVATIRGSSFSIFKSQLSGVQFPFGRRDQSDPFDVKITNFEDMGQVAPLRWRGRMTLVEVFR